MRVSKLAVGILISMILFSIFLANVANVLSTDHIQPLEPKPKNFLRITDTYDNLVWFLQVSDIHISIFRDPLRITEFREFCQHTIDILKPSVVLASGDLTDAKTKDSIGSEQFENEWKYYRDILNETLVKRKTIWLDIRGNHDNFNVADKNSKHNFFMNYSVQGKQHPRSYIYQIKKRGVLYSFIGIDACLEPGPRRPFNFVGMLDDIEIMEINALIHKAESTNTNYTVFFGHFPTSCILTTGHENVRSLIGKHHQGLVYVCGHLHKLGGLVPRMYTMQKAGFLELELGDWKDNRVYRLLAIDQGLFSFVDLHHREWPVVLITNPKHALFINPARENVDSMKNSTHIRILAFSISKIDFVKVKVDDSSWVNCKRVKGPLYVVHWNTEEYLTGMHQIEVYVKDIDGRTKSVKQPFSLDGSRMSFGLLPKIALMSNASFIFRTLFFVMLCLSVVPLCLFRYLHFLITVGKVVKPVTRKGCLFLWLRKLWILSTVNKMFWPIVLYPIYLAIGPWSIGYIVEDHIGAIFAWGIIVNQAFLPGAFTYAYGFVQLFTFQIPLTLIMANTVHHRFLEITLKKGKQLSRKTTFCLHLPFSIIFIMQLVMAYLFWLAYGTLAFILGPLRTWSLVLAVILHRTALNLDERSLRKAVEVWQTKSDTIVSQDDISLAPIEKIN